MEIEATGDEKFVMKCQLNYIGLCSGSAAFSDVDTMAIAAVYGPQQVSLYSSDYSGASVEVVCRRRAALRVNPKPWESFLQQLCQNAIITKKYPRSSVKILITEIEDYGGLLACAINATCAALIHSGIAMNYVFASACCTISSDGKITLQPTEIRSLQEVLREKARNQLEGNIEEEREDACLTFVFENTSNNMICCDTMGIVTPAQINECISICRKKCEKVFVLYKKILKKHFTAIAK